MEINPNINPQQSTRQEIPEEKKNHKILWIVLIVMGSLVVLGMIALVIVSFVWSNIKPDFENSNSVIDLGTECLNSEIKLISCTYDQQTNIAYVEIQKSAGSAKEAVIIIESTDESTQAKRIQLNNDGALLVTTSIDIEPSGSAPYTIETAAIVSKESNERTCPLSPTKITCQ